MMQQTSNNHDNKSWLIIKLLQEIISVVLKR